MDECERRDRCPDHANCENSDGSYTCTCITGFHLITGSCLGRGFLCFRCDLSITGVVYMFRLCVYGTIYSLVLGCFYRYYSNSFTDRRLFFLICTEAVFIAKFILIR